MKYYLRKLLLLAVTLVLVSLITFGVFQILPGDPVLVMLGVEIAGGLGLLDPLGRLAALPDAVGIADLVLDHGGIGLVGIEDQLLPIRVDVALNGSDKARTHDDAVGTEGASGGASGFGDGETDGSDFGDGGFGGESFEGSDSGYSGSSEEEMDFNWNF